VKEGNQLSETKVNMAFGREFRGEMQAKNATVQVGKEENCLAPYEMLLGGLGACFYSTFVDIADKMRLSFDRAQIALSGVRREEAPRHLVRVTLVFTVFGAEQSKGFLRAVDLAEKYCSIRYTVAQVADIQVVTVFSI
jgi:putative redox protein